MGRHQIHYHFHIHPHGLPYSCTPLTPKPLSVFTAAIKRISQPAVKAKVHLH